MSSPITYEDINWRDLRKNAFARKGWSQKTSKDWDAKATSFSRRNHADPYVDLVLENLPLSRELSVLDVASGPGTLALPISAFVRKVTALDFSSAMLRLLEERAQNEDRSNIDTICCSWEDDWELFGIVPHDLALASRAVGGENLELYIEKLNHYANKYVFMTDRIGATPFEKAAFHAIGRSFDPGPDYIYTINMLYSMGIYPHIQVLTLQQEKTFATPAEAFEAYSWMFHEMTPTEKCKLGQYIEKHTVKTTPDGKITVRRTSAPKWALIWWEKHQLTTE